MERRRPRKRVAKRKRPARPKVIGKVFVTRTGIIEGKRMQELTIRSPTIYRRLKERYPKGVVVVPRDGEVVIAPIGFPRRIRPPRRRV